MMPASQRPSLMTMTMTMMMAVILHPTLMRMPAIPHSALLTMPARWKSLQHPALPTNVALAIPQTLLFESPNWPQDRRQFSKRKRDSRWEDCWAWHQSPCPLPPPSPGNLPRLRSRPSTHSPRLPSRRRSIMVIFSTTWPSCRPFRHQSMPFVDDAVATNTLRCGRRSDPICARTLSDASNRPSGSPGSVPPPDKHNID